MKHAIFKMLYSVAIIAILAGVRHYVNFEIAVLFGLAFICSEIYYKNDKP